MKHSMHSATLKGRRFCFFGNKLNMATCKLVSLFPRSSIVAACLVLFQASSTFAQDQALKLDDLRAEVISAKSFDETIKHLKWRFGEHGLAISWASNYAEIVNRDQVKVKNVVIFELLRRNWLEHILVHEPSAALAMPIRVLVIETETGETLVSYNRLSVLMLSSSNSELKVLGETVDEKLARIVRLSAAE